jgi:hypothetical protein
MSFWAADFPIAHINGKIGPFPFGGVEEKCSEALDSLSSPEELFL